MDWEKRAKLDSAEIGLLKGMKRSWNGKATWLKGLCKKGTSDSQESVKDLDERREEKIKVGREGLSYQKSRRPLATLETHLQVQPLN